MSLLSLTSKIICYHHNMVPNLSLCVSKDIKRDNHMLGYSTCVLKVVLYIFNNCVHAHFSSVLSLCNYLLYLFRHQSSTQFTSNTESSCQLLVLSSYSLLVMLFYFFHHMPFGLHYHQINCMAFTISWFFRPLCIIGSMTSSLPLFFLFPLLFY